MNITVVQRPPDGGSAEEERPLVAQRFLFDLMYYACLAIGVVLVGQPFLKMVTMILIFFHLYTVCQTVD